MDGDKLSFTDRIKAHILRRWGEDTELPHASMRNYPPFVYELILYIGLLSALYSGIRKLLL